jgi:hypothetical protein
MSSDPSTVSAPVLLTLYVEAGLVRAARPRRCPVCGLKRVLVAVSVSDVRINGGGISGHRCLECWGVRDHAR